MDDLDLSNLPTGYERIVDKTGRVAYLTPFPRVKIRSIRQLNEYHAEGRYLSLTESFVKLRPALLEKWKDKIYLASLAGVGLCSPMKSLKKNQSRINHSL